VTTGVTRAVAVAMGALPHAVCN
jgi:hypothetical protein